MKILTVHHVTTYRYKQPVSLGEHRMMLRPRDSYDQRLIEARLVIEPEPAVLNWTHDAFGNCVAIARFAGRADRLVFDSMIRLDHEPNHALDFELEDYAREYPFAYSADEIPDLSRTIERQYLDREREVDRWARQFLRKQGPTGTRDLLAAVTHAIHERFAYISRSEMGTQDPAATLRIGSGSCRDFALLMMEAVRSLGLAARFVSGYLAPSGEIDRARLGGESTHAWCEVYLPGAGWVEYDPTNGLVGNDALIRVAVVRDPRQAVPISGTWTGFPSDFIDMTVDVAVVPEAPPAPEEPARVRA
ncbi:MAG TPA: transglutaminase family protein [Stellaceae bacterium]|nr:transglutaminase family protein [Stellaceae bacterium]